MFGLWRKRLPVDKLAHTLVGEIDGTGGYFDSLVGENALTDSDRLRAEFACLEHALVHVVAFRAFQGAERDLLMSRLMDAAADSAETGPIAILGPEVASQRLTRYFDGCGDDPGRNLARLFCEVAIAQRDAKRDMPLSMGLAVWIAMTTRAHVAFLKDISRQYRLVA